MLKKIVAVAALAALAACTQTSTSGGAAAAPKTHWLRISMGSGDVPSLNPLLFAETPLGQISELTMAYFARYDAHGKPVPELLTVIPTQANGGISKDGKTITWHLRHGVRWSDGAPFTAADVIFTVKAVMNPKNNVIGTDGFNLIDLKRMAGPDQYTVVFHLKHPYAAYLPTFFGTAGANPCILPAHLLAGLPDINHAAYNAKPVGIGPFRVTEWRRGDAVEMEANPYYWRGTPKLKRITYKLIPDRNTLLTAMQTGDVDIWPMVPTAFIDQVKGIGTLNVTVVPSSYYAHVDFNVRHPLVSDPRVRQAIRYALDRPEMVRKIGHGYGILEESPTSILNPIAPTVAEVPLIPFAPDKARALLDAAGWKVGKDGIRVKDGKRLSLDFPYYTGAVDADQRVEMMRAELKAVGVEITTRKFAPTSFFAQDGVVNKGNYDITFYSWGTDPVGDISNLFQSTQMPPNGQDSLFYKNAQLDAWLQEFKNSYDPALHKKLLLEEVRQIVKDAPTIVLYLAQDGYAVNKKVTGYAPGSFTQFDDMMNVDV